MKRYCFDTSGLSNPLEFLPEDIHGWLWVRVCETIESGTIAVTTEIYEEMTHIPGMVGACIRANRHNLLLEVGDAGWPWEAYVDSATALQLTHREFISEFTGGSPKTVCLNDITIIAMSQSLRLPLVSMEARIIDPGAKKRKIPNVCDLEGIPHRVFNDFLRAEGIVKPR